MKQILQRLVAKEILSQEDTKQIMVNITKEQYSNEQIAAMLGMMQMRGVSVDELLGFREGLLETGKPVDLSDYNTIDIVGTGGDGKNTFNISTCSCFVLAGAGYKVAKHGNVAASSVSGASNVLMAHGVKFTDDVNRHKENLEKAGITYLHAPLFAYGMKFVGPIRKSLQVPTVFNLLGPLVNPSKPKNQMLGTANLNQLRLYTNVYQKMGINYTIVTSTDGYDEISLTSSFKVSSVGEEKVYSVAEIGLPAVLPDEICGGKDQTLDDAKKVFDDVLANKANRGPMNVVLINSAFAIRTFCPQKSIEECIAEARESIESGKAMQALKNYVALNS
ncbi:MAG: anthranilate phosphoribosyltransferase [Salinivirgaceae bacterium]|nr:anthranilate phosphoribosyltransferase [Salinivirgaceae bacterium]